MTDKRLAWHQTHQTWRYMVSGYRLGELDFSTKHKTDVSRDIEIDVALGRKEISHVYIVNLRSGDVEKRYRPQLSDTG